VRTEQLRREFGLNLRLTCFPLHPETPEQGQSLEQLFAGRLDIPAMLARLKQVADSLGLPFDERTHTYNSRRAQELGKWAEQQGAGEAFHQAVYHAYFAQGLNIAQPEILLGIVEELGLATQDAAEVLHQQIYAAAVDADWQRAQELGITAVPTAVYEKRKLVGFADEAEYRRLIHV